MKSILLIILAATLLVTEKKEVPVTREYSYEYAGTWKSGEKKPKKEGRFLCIMQDGSYIIATDTNYDDSFRGPVKFWTELPTPPKLIGEKK